MTRFFTKCLGLLCLAVLCCFSLQNVVAQCGAGETEVTLDIFTGTSFPHEIAWQLTDGSGAVVDEVPCDTYGSSETDTNMYCLNDGETYNFDAYDSFGDSWGFNATATMSITSSGCAIFSSTDPGASSTLDSDVSGNPLVTGCSSQSTDPDLEESVSFTTVVQGCTDPTADNYNACATADDGSCFFNDFCASAEAIACGDTKTGNTSTATADSAPFCGTGDSSAGGVWYKFTGTGGDITASLCNSSFDTKIRVYTGTCSALICEVGVDDNFVACGGGGRSEVTFTSVQCTEYYILVHGFSSGAGLFQLDLTCVGGVAVVDEGCTDPTAHNYDGAACNDDSSCETCTDGILNGDEIDVDCGGALCDDCPCDIQSSASIASYEGGCNNQAKARIVVVEFSGGIQPLDYAISSASGTFVTQKETGVYQVNGNGTWSIAASDASGCINEVEGSDFVYVSNTASTSETNTDSDGTAMVEVSGGTPPYAVVWSNGVEGSIPASGGSHSILGLGRGKYEATVTDDEGGTALACVNVARVSSTGGRGGRGRGRKADISDVMNTLTVNPNPFADNTTVHFNLPENGMATVNVFALDGQKVATIFEGQTEASENYTVELTSAKLTSGIYILQLTSEAGVVAHQRIVVTK